MGKAATQKGGQRRLSKAVRDGEYLIEGILRLTAQGLSLPVIYELPLDVFNLYLEAAGRIDAGRRLGYISDTSSAVASVLGAGKEAKSHIDALVNHSEGKPSG